MNRETQLNWVRCLFWIKFRMMNTSVCWGSGFYIQEWYSSVVVLKLFNLRNQINLWVVVSFIYYLHLEATMSSSRSPLANNDNDVKKVTTTLMVIFARYQIQYVMVSIITRVVSEQTKVYYLLLTTPFLFYIITRFLQNCLGLFASHLNKLTIILKRTRQP